MYRRQSDEDDEPQDRTNLIIGLFVLFVITLILFLVIATNYVRSQAEARSVADIAATEAALGSEMATLTPDFGSVLLFPTETLTATPTETETAVPTETETVMPTEVDTPAPLVVDTSSPTPESIIPVTGVDLREEQAAAARQWIRIGVGILAYNWVSVSLFPGADERIAQVHDSAVNYTWDRNPQADQAILEFTREMQPSTFKSVIRYKNFKGEDQEQALWKPLLHWFNHQTHHRGQISVLLDLVGVNNDYSSLLPRI